MPSIPAAYAAATFLSTLVGGFFALRFSAWMDRIMAFSGGVLLAAGLLDLLPEAISLHLSSVHLAAGAQNIYRPLLLTTVGFTLFYLVERMAILRSYHSHHHHPETTALELSGGEPHPTRSPSHDHGHRHSQGAAGHHGHPEGAVSRIGILGAAGLCIHSVLDGFSIGVAFHANASLGVLIAGAVIAHDFSDGITTVTVLLSNQGSRKASIVWLVLDALAPLLGVALAVHLGLTSEHLADLLSLFAGMFIYLGATHMLPEAHAISDSWITVSWTLAGILLMVGVTRWMG